MSKLVLHLLTSVVISTVLVCQGRADHCPCGNGFCKDGTRCTPCCGYKGCNIFCRGCDCRRGTGDKSTNEQAGLDNIDTNADDLVDREEAYAYLKSGQCGNYTDKLADFEQGFKLLDKNGDGRLTLEEIETVFDP